MCCTDKRKNSAHITALTMGPTQSKKILREAFMMDADESILLTDRAFAGADVLATSYTLSQAIGNLGKSILIYALNKQPMVIQLKSALL